MIIIDASTVFDAFDDEYLRSKILGITKPLRAPELLVKEVNNHKSYLMEWSQLSHQEFENRWQAFLRKIVIDDPNESHIARALVIIKKFA